MKHPHFNPPKQSECNIFMLYVSCHVLLSYFLSACGLVLFSSPVVILRATGGRSPLNVSRRGADVSSVNTSQARAAAQRRRKHVKHLVRYHSNTEKVTPENWK